ncbi:Alkyl sulfatase dimerisation [Salipiger thiooxidans]|uniref:Alkyl sulfatase dimerisation n=1 Tax=Salipiger thiooxidans TaxID=282683 RepID=A0A1G7BUI5_9RHOB|nr:Alkyl sulfatase dimerisation [Salipiger thiooxidans]
MNNAGGYRWVATALKHMAFAEPDNAEAKNLLADALTQMGHQTKIGPWRNFQLSGAKELRDGVVEAAPPLQPPRPTSCATCRWGPASIISRCA